MSSQSILANMTSGWGGTPGQSLIGLRDEQTSAALWTSTTDGRFEVCGEPDKAPQIFGGFQYFATIFRKHMGATPSADRRERLS